MRRRSITLAVAALMLIGAACTKAGAGDKTLATDQPSPAGTKASPTASEREAMSLLRRQVCDLPHPWLVRTWRGWKPGISGDLQIIPQYPNVVAANGIYPHAGPWGYLENVPMVWYGPGYIRHRGTVNRPVTSADVAPTMADLLHYDFDAPDGRSMTEALVPADQRRTPPRLILTVVYDAGGWDVLNRWPDQHPVLDRLEREGTSYLHATVGSNPTSTAQIHATLGTGAFPRLHGVIGNHLREDGTIRAPWTKGPGDLKLPTLADEYDRDMGNEPLIGEAVTAPFHLAMMSHGSFLEGGDKDVAVLHGSQNGADWGLGNVQGQYYSFPEWVNDLPTISTYFDVADRSDGTVDGTWRGMDIAHEKAGFDTPARLPYQTNVVRHLIPRDGFGADSTPDLFFLNYKLIDEVGHIWNLDSPEMHDTLKVQDNQLPKLIGLLNQVVGRGKWVMVLTADHGHTPDPRITGAIRIDKSKVEPLVEDRFGGPAGKLIQSMQPSWLFMNMDNVRKNGASLAEISKFLMTLTVSQVATSDTRELIRPGHGDDPAFQIAFPSTLINDLPCLPEARTDGG